jgi:hypothetical protein
MTRTTLELRNRIEQAAAQSGRSLAQEVERRLEQSFEPNVLLKTLLLEVLYEIQQVIKQNKGREFDLEFWTSFTDAAAAAEQEVLKHQSLDARLRTSLAHGYDAMFKGAMRHDHKESAIDESGSGVTKSDLKPARNQRSLRATGPSE